MRRTSRRLGSSCARGLFIAHLTWRPVSTIPAPSEPSRGTSPAQVPEATIAVAVETIAEALSPATRRAYAAGWATWEAWATAHGAEALPANPAELVLWLSDAAYDVDGEPALAPATCAQRLAAVAHQHRTTVEASTGEPLADPTKHPRVREWLRGYRRRTAALGAGAPRQAAPLTATAAAAIRAVATTPRPGRGGRPESPEVARRRGTQDLVIVGLARDGLLRRAELAAIHWGDLQPAPDGGAGVLTVRRSKTDPDGAGAVLWISPQTMRDVSAWRALQAAGGADVGAEAPLVGLSAPSIARRLAAAGAAAGLDGRLSGHSGRVGMAQDLVAHGLDLAATMAAGRWATPTEVVRYTRHLAVDRGAVARYYAERGEADA